MARKDREADRAYKREWRLANRDRLRAKDRERYLANKDAYAANARRWEAENPDRAREIKRKAGTKYRSENRVYRNMTSRKWAKLKRDRDKLRIYKRGYYLLNRERVLESNAERFQNNRSRYLANQRTARQRVTPEQFAKLKRAADKIRKTAVKS